MAEFQCGWCETDKFHAILQFLFLFTNPHEDMTRIPLFIILCIFSADVTAQSLEAILGARMSSSLIITKDRNAPEVLGHPYAHNRWAKGTFRTTMNNEYRDVDLKFDAHSNALVILYKADSLLVKPNVVREFNYVIDNQTFYFRNGFDSTLEGLNAETYLMVLSVGRWSIYKDVRKVYKKSDFDPTYHTGSRYDSYQEQDRYIVRSPDGEWSQLRVNRRNLTRLFGDQGREVDQYIRKRRMDVDNDAHLSHIFEFASGLE